MADYPQLLASEAIDGRAAKQRITSHGIVSANSFGIHLASE
jgi:hypothetical protein